LTLTNFWQLLAGLGMFLYGMFHLEDSMKQLDGRGFKLFLKKHTKNKLGAIFSGTIVTAIMQSSSIVNLIVLSFVGAGMLSMRNALGVALGANLGGTFNSWLVAMLGFKAELGKFTLPIIGIAGLGLIVFKNNKKITQISKFCMGFGLLFLGLQYMKESMDSLIKQFDFAPYLIYPSIVFVLIGFVITALIQTSAATVVVVLSALYSKIITIEIAVAVVLGAELGTTIKILIGSIGGIAAKKCVAYGNSIFNIVSSTIGFIFLVPLIKIIQNYFGVHDVIYILVMFQTIINLIGVFIFYFLLNGLATFLEKRFLNDDKSVTVFVQNVSPTATDTAIEMIEKEVGLFIFRTIQLNMQAFKIVASTVTKNEYKKYDVEKFVFSKKLSYDEKYSLLKEAEGEILLYYSKVSETAITKQNFEHVNQLISSLRNAMYAAKGIKDIVHNGNELSNSANQTKYDSYKLFQEKLSIFYVELIEIYDAESKTTGAEKLQTLFEKVKNEYQQLMNKTYGAASNQLIKDIDIATIFNVNREIFSSCKSMILAQKDYMLDSESALAFKPE